MRKHQIIQKIIDDNDYTSYLEIGYGNGDTFKKINIRIKDGVDIGHGVPPEEKKNCKFLMASAEFFKINRTKYDVIFIDGSHFYKDVLQDVLSSIQILNENGTIVLHDCNPPSEIYQMIPYVPGAPGWTGDVWKAFLELRMSRTDLEMFTVDSDYGCGVIKYGKQELFKTNENIFDYNFFDKYRKEILNLVSIESFIK